jgi:hypothetical protein
VYWHFVQRVTNSLTTETVTCERAGRRIPSHALFLVEEFSSTSQSGDENIAAAAAPPRATLANQPSRHVQSITSPSNLHRAASTPTPTAGSDFYSQPFLHLLHFASAVHPFLLLLTFLTKPLHLARIHLRAVLPLTLTTFPPPRTRSPRRMNRSR